MDNKNNSKNNTSLSKQTDVKKHSRSKKKKRKKYFKAGLLIYSAFLAIVFITILFVLWNKLSSYQKDIDLGILAEEQEKEARRAPQILFEKTVSSMNEDEWVQAYYNSHPDCLDKDSDVRSLIERLVINNPYSLYKAPEYTASTPVYLVTNQTEDIARFYITGTGDNAVVSNIEFLASGDCSGEITVPDNASIYCNDILLSDQYAAEADGFMNTDFSSDLVNPVKYKTYHVEKLLSEPEFRIENNSDDTTIETDIEGNHYPVLENKSEYQTTGESFVKSLLYYYSQGKNSASANMASALSYVASGSEAASIIRQSLDGVLWRYPTNTSYETSVSKVFVLAENCYFVDVEYKELNTDNTNTEVYRVYFLDTGNGFKIYHFSMM